MLVADLAAASPKPPLRGIVFILSDGTSQELLTASRCYAQGAEGKLVLDSYPQTAFVSTYSANDMVTDSAAAATALFRGIKEVPVRSEVGELKIPGEIESNKAEQALKEGIPFPDDVWESLKEAAQDAAVAPPGY